MQEAAAPSRQWRVDPDLGSSGRIRVIDMPAGIDQNQCSGSRVPRSAAASRCAVAGASVAMDCLRHGLHNGVPRRVAVVPIRNGFRTA
jgi:hypothetical protein